MSNHMAIAPNAPLAPADGVEFLPPWYARLRRRRRRLVAQAVLAAALAAAVPLRVAHTRQLARREEASLAELNRSREHQRQTDLVLAKLGRHVEPARLLATIERATPAAVRVTELTVESEPHPLDFFTTAYLAAMRAAPGEASRRVTVQLRGAAPSPVEAANFVAALSKQPDFRDVAMTYARDRAAAPDDVARGAAGATVHDFRVTFWLDLANEAGGAALAAAGEGS